MLARTTCFSLLVLPIAAAQTPVAPDRPATRRLPLEFVENVGQWPAHSRFVARRPGVVAHFERHAIVLQLLQRRTDKLHAEVIRLAFENADESSTVSGDDPRAARFHYFRGKDAASWHTNARAFGRLRYRGVWEGIDVRVRDRAGVLEYDLIVAPEASLEDAVVTCQNVRGLQIDSDGKLRLETAAGTLRQSVPVAWFEDERGTRTPVACRFRRIDEQRFGFDAPQPERGQTLVIDPGLEWSTYLGGSGYDYYWKLLLGPKGVPVAAGYTASATFPTTAGSYDTSFNGRYDAVVTKMSVDGRSIVWSAFLGGADEDWANGLAVSPSGEAFVTGFTKSRNYPSTPGAFQVTNQGGNGDAFVSRLSADGSKLVYSTFLGGPAWEYGAAVDVDKAGNATVIGVTKSTSFPLSSGAFDTTHNGGGDGFVARLDPTGSKLLFSTFLGSSGWDPLNDVLVDDKGDVFVVADIFGVNNTSNFPTTPGAYDRTYNDTSDRSDTIVCKLSGDGTKLLWSTWLGGNSWDPCYAIELDDDGNPVICGESWSTNFPLTRNAYQTTYNGDGDAYVAKLSADGSRLIFATFLGGRWEDRALTLGLDPFGAIVVGGFTRQKINTNPNDFPTTPGAFSRTFKGATDGFVARLSPDASKLYYSSLVNGSDFDNVYTLALDARGAAFVAGDTAGTDFPTTPGAFDRTYNGGGDAYMALAELLPLGTTRFGTWTPGCTAATPIGITVEPRDGARAFALLGAGAPPTTAGLLLLGAARFPAPLPILGAGIYIDITQPAVLLPIVSDRAGRTTVPLPLATGLRGLRLYNQLLWFNTPSCGGLGRLSGSNGLDMTVR